MNWKPRCKVVHIIWAGGEIILLFLMLEIPGLRFQSVFLELFYMFLAGVQAVFSCFEFGGPRLGPSCFQEGQGLGQVVFEGSQGGDKFSSRGFKSEVVAFGGSDTRTLKGKLRSKEDEWQIVLLIFYLLLYVLFLAIGRVFYRAFSRHRKEAEGPGF